MPCAEAPSAACHRKQHRPRLPCRTDALHPRTGGAPRRCAALHRNGRRRGHPCRASGQLRESFEHDLTNEYAAHVGLYNIQKVIRLTYGAPYGVQIESTEGQGPL